MTDSIEPDMEIRLMFTGDPDAADGAAHFQMQIRFPSQGQVREPRAPTVLTEEEVMDFAGAIGGVVRLVEDGEGDDGSDFRIDETLL